MPAGEMSKFKNSIGIGRQPGMYSFLQRIPVRDSLESTGKSVEIGFKKSGMHHIVQVATAWILGRILKITKPNC